MSDKYTLDPLVGMPALARREYVENAVGVLATLLGFTPDSAEGHLLRQHQIDDDGLVRAGGAVRGVCDEVERRADTSESEHRSALELLVGNPNSALVRKAKWLQLLREVDANGAERMVVLDAAAPGGVHSVVDVRLALSAAELDVLDELAPGLRSSELAEQVKEHLHVQALQAMADKDARCVDWNSYNKPAEGDSSDE